MIAGLVLGVRSEILRHRPAVHGGIHSVTRPRRKVIDFSSSVGPLRPPRRVLAALAADSSDTEYPDPASDDVRAAVARRERVRAGQVIVGAGATQLIHDYCSAHLGASARVLVQAPTFGEYEAAALLRGARVSRFVSMDLAVDLDAFIAAIPRRGCVFVCNPNNPTGALLSRRDVLAVARAAARHGSIALVDECFIELSYGESVARDAQRLGNLFVLRSFTKSFGIPGVRVGYAVTSARLAGLMRRAQPPWAVSAAAQRAALAALSCPDHLERSRRAAAREVRYLRSAIGGIDGFECMGEPAANYVLVRTHADPARLQRRLVRRGVLVRDCGSFAGLRGRFIRVAARSRRENRVLLEALRDS